MGNNSWDDIFIPTEVDFVPEDDDYTIKEISWGESHAGMIVDYKGSNQIYMWGTAWKGGLGYTGSGGQKTLEVITKLDQTPMITFDNGPPSVVNDDENGEKTLSFTLDWNESSVSPTKIELIDSKGTVINGASLEIPELKPGIKTEINIANIATEGIDNVRLKVSNENNDFQEKWKNTLVISQSFDIPNTIVNEFTDSPIVNYNWMTAKKNLSFTLFYYPNISLDSIQLINVGTGQEIEEISINYKEIESEIEYNVDISKFTNKSTIKARIEVKVSSGSVISDITSDVFEIPSTKIKGWVIISVSLIALLAVSIISTTLIITYKIRAKNKIQKMKAHK